MNEKLVNAALQSYEKDASENEIARFEFFREVWKIQSDQASTVADQQGYEGPSAEEAEAMYWEHKPFFLRHPVLIAPDEFKRVLELISSHLGEKAGLDDTVIKALEGYNWSAFVEKADLALAGKDPAGFIEECLEHIDEYEVPTDLSATVFAMVPVLALRAFLQEPAQKCMGLFDVTEKQKTHESPLDCPVCGSKPVLAIVGEGSTLQGGGKTLFCSLCGTEWAFERVRCALCGNTDPMKLHYFNIEGDEMHRLQNCRDCGGYVRVVYQGSSKHPICADVEDVVMARLDMVANDARFRSQMNA